MKKELERICNVALEKQGYSKEDAARISEVLIATDMFGSILMEQRIYICTLKK